MRKSELWEIRALFALTMAVAVAIEGDAIAVRLLIMAVFALVASFVMAYRGE